MQSQKVGISASISVDLLIDATAGVQFIVDLFAARLWLWAEEESLFLISRPVVHFEKPDYDHDDGKDHPEEGYPFGYLRVTVIARAVPVTKIVQQTTWGTEAFASC